MRLTYWLSECYESTTYSIRCKTKRAVVLTLASYDPTSYGPVHKVSVEYDGAFDLLDQCMNEGRGYWEV